MDIGSVLSRSWAIYKKFFPRLFVLAAAVYLVTNLFSTAALWKLEDYGVNKNVGMAAFVAITVVVFSLVGNMWVQGAMVEATADMRDGESDLTPVQMLSNTKDDLGPIVGASLLSSIPIAIGLVLFLLPGFYLFTIWSMIIPAIVLEKVGVMQSFSRSREIVRGNGFAVFALLAVIILIGLVAGIFASMIQRAVGESLVSTWIAGALVGALTAPLTMVAMTLAYFDLTENRLR